jgi:hypothetical protein
MQPNDLNILGLRMIFAGVFSFGVIKIIRFTLFLYLRRKYSNTSEYEKVNNIKFLSIKEIDLKFTKYSDADPIARASIIAIKILKIIRVPLLIIGILLYLFGGLKDKL